MDEGSASVSMIVRALSSCFNTMPGVWGVSSQRRYTTLRATCASHIRVETKPDRPQNHAVVQLVQ